MGNKQKLKIEELTQEISKLKLELEVKDDLIKNQVANYKIEIENLNNKNSELLKLKEEESNNKLKVFELKVNELENQNNEKQKQLNLQETKKLAKAYENQKAEYEKKSEDWAGRLLVATFLLIISTIISINISYGKAWYDRFEFYLIDIIFISAVWFCVSQYSYYVKLYADFANRQVLAQSYYNIINSTEDVIIKDKFLDKATEVLCSKNNIDHKDNLPTEKIINSTFELAKDAIKKLS